MSLPYTSQRSTPIKTKDKTAGSKAGGIAYSKPDPAKVIHKYLVEEVGPYQHHNIDLLDFAERVWGLDRKIGEQILGMDLTLDQTELTRYRRYPHETDLHQPFDKFSRALLGAVVAELGDPESILTAQLWDGRGTRQIVHDGRTRKPDMLYIWKVQMPVNPAVPQWTFVKHPLEFKHGTYKDKFTLPAIPAWKKQDIKDSFRTATAQDTPVPKGKPKRAVQSERDADSINRRKRERESGSDEELESKKSRVDDRHAQLATYAIECLSSTSRRWVTGLLVDTCVITACYFDRHMVACTVPFHFDREPAKLALVLYSMNVCTKDRAGFDLHLRRSLASSTSVGVGEDATLPVTDLVGSYFVFPEDSPANQSADEDAEEDAEKDSSRISKGDEDTDPEKGDSNEKNHVSTSGCFRITGSLRKPDDLISRGTAVYKVKRRLPTGEFSDEDYALKMSSPLQSRVGEVDIIKHLKNVLPASSHDHLPHLIFSKTWSAAQLHLPWLDLKLSLNQDNHQQRVLCALAAKQYKKLWEAGSVRRFKQAWLDCVEVHYLAYRMGKVLHRDLSESNLMVLPVGEKKVKGVLNDWDMAKFVYDQYDGLLAGHHRTGTPPFMAIDLLPSPAIPIPEPVSAGKESSDSDSSSGSESSDSEDEDDQKDSTQEKEKDSEGDQKDSAEEKGKDGEEEEERGRGEDGNDDTRAGGQDEDAEDAQQKPDPSAPPHWLRHDFESLFYILVWAALHYNLKKGTRDSNINVLVAKWTEDTEGNANAKKIMLDLDPGYAQKLNHALKEEFRKSELAAWVESLRALFAKARNAYKSALYENEDIDAATYGGRLTFKTFMAAINVTPRTWGLGASYLESDD